MTTIRIEANSAGSKHKSGVGFYTQLLINSLASQNETTVRIFTFNFLDRQPQPDVISSVVREENKSFPLKIYAKLQSLGLAWPFDLFRPKVELTIFPNYARWPTIKSCYTATVIHDLTYLHYPELMESKNLRHLERVVPRSIKKSDFIITVSESVKKELIDTFSLNPDSIIVTPIPPSPEFNQTASLSLEEIRNKYNISTPHYFFFMGNIEPRKDIPTLIKAYELLPQAIRDTYSVVISGGMGWKSNESKAAITNAIKSGLHVIYTGYVDNQDKPALYQHASLYIMPSLYEGFGMPILEAAASKVPIVASDIPVLREAGGNGVSYFTPKDAISLSEKILSVIEDEDLSQNLIIKAESHLASFSWNDNAQSILNKLHVSDK